jgi:hypothetical protein
MKLNLFLRRKNWHEWVSTSITFSYSSRKSILFEMNEKDNEQKSTYNTFDPIASKCVRCSAVSVQWSKRRKRKKISYSSFSLVCPVQLTVNLHRALFSRSLSSTYPLSDQCIGRLSMTRSIWHSYRYIYACLRAH